MLNERNHFSNSISRLHWACENIVIDKLKIPSQCGYFFVNFILNGNCFFPYIILLIFIYLANFLLSISCLCNVKIQMRAVTIVVWNCVCSILLAQLNSCFDITRVLNYICIFLIQNVSCMQHHNIRHILLLFF